MIIEIILDYTESRIHHCHVYMAFCCSVQVACQTHTFVFSGNYGPLCKLCHFLDYRICLSSWTSCLSSQPHVTALITALVLYCKIIVKQRLKRLAWRNLLTEMQYSVRGYVFIGLKSMLH